MAAHGARCGQRHAPPLRGEQDAAPAQKVVAEIKAGRDRGGEHRQRRGLGSPHRIVKTRRFFGKIDVVVNNAVSCATAFSSTCGREWKAVIDVHLNARLLSRAAAPYFRARIPAVTSHDLDSVLGNFVQPIIVCQLARPLSKSMALTCQVQGASNCISPSPGEHDGRSPRTRTTSVALEGPDGTAKIANIAVYLASDASQAVTGQIFAVRANETSCEPEGPALGASRRGLDAGDHCGTGHAGDACAFLCAGPLAGCVLVGPHLISLN